MQVVQVEQVDGMTVELLDVAAWHVEVADYNKFAVERAQAGRRDLIAAR